jgi:DNA-binding NarL/FixJ family response regulator
MTRVLVAGTTSRAREPIEDLRANGSPLIVEELQPGEDLVARIDRGAPDAVVLEADGDESVADVLNGVDPRAVPVVVLARHADPLWSNALVRAGVRAVLPSGARDLSAAIAAVAAGYIVLHPEVADALVPAGLALRERNGQSLTTRELEVLRMMAEGLANKVIAAKLNISEHTVKFHVGSIFAKLHAGSRTEAVALGARQGLVML